MSCSPKCAKTGTWSGVGNKRLMISMGINSKFPKDFAHPQCDSCIAEELEEAKIAVLFNNDRKLIDRWRKIKDKMG